MRKVVAQMIKTSKIHELITYSANVLLSTLSSVNMRTSVNNEFLCESRKLLIQYRKEWMSSKAIGRGRKISYALIAYFPRIYRVAYLASHREKT